MRQISIFIFFIFQTMASSQIPLGHWRDHLCFYDGEIVLTTKEKVYCVANGNLFYYNKSDASINHLNKVQGLTDMGVSAIGYDPELDMLVVGYENGNIDLIDYQGVFNIGAIERKQVPASKRINNIIIEDKTAYISTGFALVLLNLENKEIKDTYYLGNNNEKINVRDVALDEKYIYALIEDGVLRADKNSPTLIDNTQWELIVEHKTANGGFKDIETFYGKVYLTLVIDGYRNDTMFVIEDSGLKPMDFNFDADFYSLRKNNGYLIITKTWVTVVYDQFFNQKEFIIVSNALDADIDENSIVWIAGVNSGVTRIEGKERDTIIPRGPNNIGAYDLAYGNQTMWVAAGSPGNPWNKWGIHKFQDEKWQTLDIESDTGFTYILNVSKVVVDPKDPNHVFGGSFGYGLVELRNNKIVKNHNISNSILKPIEGYGEGYLRVTGMDFDNRGNLYFVVSQTKNPLYVLTTEGEIVNIETDYNGFNNLTIHDMTVSSKGYIWILFKNNGVFVLDPAGTPTDFSDDRENKFNPVNDDGNSTSDAVSIAEDNTGSIWIGTGIGPYIYSNQSKVFEVSNPIGYQVKLSDFDGLPQYLLGSERITCIEIDGANRKWLGTANSGAYLLSADGYKQIYNFTSDNSPMYSNSINSIAINDKNGEVFFATDQGILSFRGEATKANSDFGKVYVFPNPIREDYRGAITITGLAENVNVKITDISGNLIYETTALGGQAIWDGNNFDGERAHTGIYLVFCTNKDGSKTFVTKMLFIN